jgi:translation initiation factor 2 gamma subunit (eIF-2gamma)
MAQNKNKQQKNALRKTAVIGSCFCGKPAIVYAFDTYFCQRHNDELAKSFEARMNMPDNNFYGGGGA